MTKKTTHWMTDGYGNVALIEGADERDRWKPLGWSETDAPGPGTQVWVRHEETHNRARLPFAALELWRPRGWSECGPPDSADPFHAVDPADVVDPGQVSEPASPAAATKKEKQDG
ncbi:hypothetical protein TPA0907_55840 [Micromonospora humidisoli]|uniref:hypothetical protein n=1 Tax=Micromonospora sp. AKA109 TaxID=2733865 RepID=UPI0022BB5255|nr:hypothetical protein [Micromonospora sp. AKA109]GHJ11217.1 hypothetical protein TPA0907_55840 [Micromonospora sp. AKA109]